jgi:hypothetical protein
VNVTVRQYWTLSDAAPFDTITGLRISRISLTASTATISLGFTDPRMHFAPRRLVTLSEFPAAASGGR